MDEVARRPREAGPAARAEEDLPGAGVVLAPRHLEQGQGDGLPISWPAVAEVGATARGQIDLYDGRCGGPVTLLEAGGEEAAVGRESDAVGVTQAGAEHLGAGLVGRQPDQSLVARARVEPSLRIALEADHIVVATGRGAHAVRHAFVKVCLAVPVQVVQARDLVATQH